LCRPRSKVKSETVKAHGAAFTVQAVFALWYIVGHAVLSSNDPLTFALLRELLSACSLLAMAKVTDNDFSVKDTKDVFYIVALVRLSPM
jgi:hypothetical protein